VLADTEDEMNTMNGEQAREKQWIANSLRRADLFSLTTSFHPEGNAGSFCLMGIAAQCFDTGTSSVQ
jgi:hypothetical protein